MRLAIIAALAPDRRSGQVVSGILPADQAIAQVKQTIVANIAFEGLPNLAVFALDSCLRQHRFKDDAQIVPFVAEVDEADERPSVITVELGEGEDKVLINVQTEGEAEFLRKLFQSVLNTENVIAQRDEHIAALEAKLKAAAAKKAS